MLQQKAISPTNEELFQQYLQSKDSRILDRIVLENKYFIRSLANNVYKANYVASLNGCIIDASDLEQEGFIGFRKGLERYDINSGFKVITYCKSWALKYMREFYGKYEKTVKMPDSIRRIAIKGGENDIDPSSFKAMIISSFSEPTIDIECVENEHYTPDRNSTWYDYFRLITSEFSDAETSSLNILWSEGAAAGLKNIHIKALIKKIKYIYDIISSQTTFVEPLVRFSKCEMDLKTYDFWINGFCGDEYYKYKALDVFLIEKERLGFEVYNKKDYIILKIE